MFVINDDLSINITRGDTAVFCVNAIDESGSNYLFQNGDVIRIKVTEKKACENVMFQKDFVVAAETEQVEILLTEEDTKIGEVISKPTDYWYEIELNPLTNPQTIIGYDDDGAKIFKLYPEGKDIEQVEPTPEEIPVIDEELDLTSERPVQNHVIARAILTMQEEIARIDTDVSITGEDLKPLENDIETNKGNIAKNTSNIEDLSSNVENLTTTLDTHTANTSNPHNVTAEQTSYDNSISGTHASNVQGAIDELKGTIGNTSKKQLIPYPYYYTTQSQNGIAFTDLGDGRVQANGTSTDHTVFQMHHRLNKPITYEKGTYILNGTPKEIVDSGCYIGIANTGENNVQNLLVMDSGNGADLTLSENVSVGVFIVVPSGVTLNNVIFEPMLRYASIEDDTYEPYVADVQTQINSNCVRAYTEHFKLTNISANTLLMTTLTPSLPNGAKLIGHYVSGFNCSDNSGHIYYLGFLGDSTTNTFAFRGSNAQTWVNLYIVYLYTL